MRCSGLLASRRSFSLISDHSSFLQLVRDHGTGSITLQNTSVPGIVCIVVSNPSKKNAISGKMMYQLAKIVDEVALQHQSSDISSPKGIVLIGAGDSFCAGADFKLAKEVLVTNELGASMCRFMTAALNSLRECPAISVSVLNGPAIGGGAELSTSTDFRYMTPGSYCKFVHAQLGVTPGWGSVNRLQSIVGRTNALRLLGTSMPLLAGQDAISMGYADEVAEPADTDAGLETTAPGAVNRLHLQSGIDFLLPFTSQQKFPDAVACMKRAIAAIDALPKSAAMEVELEMFRRRWAGSDNKDALKSK